MDEPQLYVRDGADMLIVPLTELLQIQEEAAALAADAHKGDEDALRGRRLAAERGNAYGPQRARARLFSFFIDRAWAQIEERKMRSMITVPAEVAGEAPPAAASAAPMPTACNHPPDVACPACATSHQERRNAQKRGNGARI